MYLSKAWRASCFSLFCSTCSDVSLDWWKQNKQKKSGRGIVIEMWAWVGIIWGKFECQSVSDIMKNRKGHSKILTVLMHSSTAWVYSSIASSSFPFSSSSKAWVTRKWARSRSNWCRDFSGSLFCAWTSVKGQRKKWLRQQVIWPNSFSHGVLITLLS